MSEKCMGSSIDDFLKQEGIFEEARARAVKEVGEWQLSEAQSPVDQPQKDRSHRSTAKP
jgi:hypothetical protein